MTAHGARPEPRVCVIMPAHNAAATLGESLQSLAAQTLRDFAALIIDDGSTDATAAVARQWQQRDPRFRLLTQANAGVSAARNAGLAATRAEFLLFLDADDLLAPRALDTLLDLARRHPGVAAAYCGYVYLLPDGRRGCLFYDAEIAQAPFRVFATRSATAIHSILVRAEWVRRAGGFDETLVTCEDWDLWQRIARLGGTFAGVAQPLAIYRSREGSLSFRRTSMLRDAGTVFARGHGPDPRVSDPHTAWHDGLPAADVPRWQSLFALWCLAADAARGLNSLADVADHLRLADLADDLPAISAHLAHGLLAGSLLDKSHLLDTWRQGAGILEEIYAFIGSGSTDASLARRARLATEDEILRIAPLRQPVALTACAGLPVRLFRRPPRLAAAGVEALRANLYVGHWRLLSVMLPAPDAAGEPAVGAALAGWDADEIPGAGLPAMLRGPRVTLHQATALARLALRLLRSGQDARAVISLLPWKTAARRVLGACVPGQHHNGTSPRAADSPGEPTQPPSPQADWEAIFATPDPWRYESPYEETKYQRSLALLGDWRPARALELGCAEGHFTARLAPAVGELLAVDIAQRALERAAERCATSPNVRFRQMDFFEADLPRGFDVIVCSEVLYYLRDRRALERLIDRLTDSLTDGGRLLTAHAFVLADDETVSGFDWTVPFGMKTIREALDAHPRLRAEQLLETEAYAIALYRKTPAAAPAARPTPQRAALGAEPDAAAARMLVRGGGTSRCRLMRERQAMRVPILSYHRVARDPLPQLARYCVSPEAFASQVDWLRRRGFYPVTVDEVAQSVRSLRPLPGRPVAITFDDGYRDFAEEAWPVLQRQDFFATVFVPTGRIGATADWDAQHGPPAGLLGWDAIRRLAAQGVRFGSHLATHRRATGLSNQELAAEARDSRALLEATLCLPVTAVALPFGDGDGRVQGILAACGYRAGVSTVADTVSFNASPLFLPRLEISGEDDIGSFADKLAGAIR